MWVYHQKSGKLVNTGVLIATGYSGQPGFKNGPTKQGVVAKGPIPRGKWKMTGVRLSHPKLGPYVITLLADDVKFDDTHDETSRSAFRIHGDSVKNPGTASHGCIILPRAIRELMWKSKDHNLEVVE